MHIEFYDKESGDLLKETDSWYFVMNNEVYRDSGEVSESQSAVIGFDDFIIRCPHLGWRIKQE